ncbi:MAG TPA: hypothetical protein VGE72_07665 [Azospirillum sp.]
MARTLFKTYKVHFARITSGLRGRSERDVMVDRLKRFVADNGMAGELDRIVPHGAFGIIEIRCTEALANRLPDMPDVETVLEA